MFNLTNKDFDFAYQIDGCTNENNEKVDCLEYFTPIIQQNVRSYTNNT